MKIVMSGRVRNKLRQKHGVTEKELCECFENRAGPDLFDTRARHVTDPRTRWFLAHTNHRRLLKVVYMPRAPGEGVDIKTAYEPNDTEKRIYRTHALS